MKYLQVGSTTRFYIEDGSEFGNLQYTINKNIYSKCLTVIELSDKILKIHYKRLETKVTAEFTRNYTK